MGDGSGVASFGVGQLDDDEADDVDDSHEPASEGGDDEDDAVEMESDECDVEAAGGALVVGTLSSAVLLRLRTHGNGYPELGVARRVGRGRCGFAATATGGGAGACACACVPHCESFERWWLRGGT